MMMYELAPKNSNKGFCGKALVLEANGNQVLFSYHTPVAYIDADGNFHRTWSGWSATTGRHIVAFGGPHKADWDMMPVEPVPAY